MTVFLINISLIAAFSYLVFAGILLLKPSFLRRMNQWLAITFILMALYNIQMIFLHYAQSKQSFRLLSFYFQTDMLIGMAMCPAIYHYWRILFGYQISWKPLSIAKHGSFVLLALAYSVYFSLLPVEQRVQRLLADYTQITNFDYALNILFYLQLLIYIFVGLKMVYKYRHNRYWFYINGMKTNIRWLFNFLLLALLVLMISIPLCLWQKCDAFNTRASMVVIDLLMLYLIANTLWNTGLVMQSHSFNNTSRKTEHIRTIISESDARRVNQVMLDEKPYLKKNCNLAYLAKITGMSKEQLSHLVNDRLNQNFTDMINEYRVKYACEIFKDHKMDSYTIDVIAKTCGFGSRNNFNRVFLKIMHVKPSEYRQMYSKNRTKSLR